MSYRLLNNEDTEAIVKLLRQHAATSLFMLNNIELTQVEYNGAQYEGRYFGAFNGVELTAVLVQYWNGNLMFQGEAKEVKELWVRFGSIFSEINGFIGREDLCQLLKAKYDKLPTAKPYSTSSKERLYDLTLSELNIPDQFNDEAIECKVATAEDLEFLVPWLVDYNIEALGAKKSERLVEDTAQSTLQKIKQRYTFVVLHQGEPVATASYNAKTNPYVQIGAVWTPVHLRGNGYAQCAVAAALMMAREDGFDHSILFTDEANIPAQKAYEKLGYQRCGDFGLYILAS